CAGASCPSRRSRPRSRRDPTVETVVVRVAGAGRKRHEYARRALVIGVVRTVAKRLRLGGGDPGHAEEQEEEDGRDDPRHPPPRRRGRDERDAAPRDRLEEVVGVPRPGPEPGPRRAAVILGAGPPPGQLAVGGDRTGIADRPQRGTRPLEGAEPGVRIEADQQVRQREEDDEQRLELEEEKEV